MAISSIKSWIFNKCFKSEIARLRMEAFTNARADLKETVVETTKERIEEMTEEKLNAMLSIVDTKMIVTMDKQRGIVYLGGEKADDLTLTNLKQEAEFLENSTIWKILHENPKELAQRTMFVSSESLADMQKGKSMLYTLATQKNIIDTFKSYVLKKS